MSVGGVFHRWNGGIINSVGWDVEFTEEFEHWWNRLSVAEQSSIDVSVYLLEEYGPHLGAPHTSAIVTSRHPNMRELRVQHQGRPYRVLYAFNPLRTAVLLLGGDKTGNDRWYEQVVPTADRIYDQHLEELRKEGKI